MNLIGEEDQLFDLINGIRDIFNTINNLSKKYNNTLKKIGINLLEKIDEAKDKDIKDIKFIQRNKKASKRII